MLEEEILSATNILTEFSLDITNGFTRVYLLVKAWQSEMQTTTLNIQLEQKSPQPRLTESFKPLWQLKSQIMFVLTIPQVYIGPSPTAT